MQEKKLFGKRVKVRVLRPQDQLKQSDRYFKGVNPLAVQEFLEQTENLNDSKAVGNLEYPAQLQDALFIRIIQ
jgi:hypothetical protein